MTAQSRKISVTGLGYVGLAVVLAFSRNNRVVGYDIDVVRVSELKKGIDCSNEAEDIDLLSDKIFFTSDPQDLKKADFHIIAVPTPISSLLTNVRSRQALRSPTLSGSVPGPITKAA